MPMAEIKMSRELPKTPDKIITVWCFSLELSFSIWVGVGAEEGTRATVGWGAETIIDGFNGTGEAELGGSLGESWPGKKFAAGDAAGDAAGEDNEDSARDGDGGSKGKSEGENGDCDGDKKITEGDGDKEGEDDGNKEGEGNGNDSNRLFTLFFLSLGGPTASTTCSTLL